MDEISRIKNFQCSIKNDNDNMIIYECRNSKPETSISKIKEVIEKIALYTNDTWPNDDEWKKILPHWFICAITSHTLKEIYDNDKLWEYGSWLDAMKQRGWEWWGYNINDDGFTIQLVALTMPYSIEPFDYLLRQSGVEDFTVIAAP